MASILDVAREARVAPSTVSLVLNHRHRVSPETRSRVEKTMHRLGYTPPGRRGPASATPQTRLRVAFVYTLESMFDHSESNYCREVIGGMQTELGEGVSFSILRGAEHVSSDAILIQQLEAREFDGVILFGPETGDGYLQYLQAAGLPLVVFNRMPSHGEFSCVTTDYYGGGRQAIDHLASLGHRQIAIAVGAAAKWPAAQIRQGAVDAIQRLEGGVVIRAEDVESPEPADVQRVCKRVVEAGATALLTGDRSVGAYAECLAGMGVRVPEDFSIIGFDDLRLTTADGKMLTSIGYDKRRMGSMAATLLEQLIENKGKVAWIASAVPTYLVPGQTTAACKVTDSIAKT